MVVFPEAFTTLSVGMNIYEMGFSLTHGNAQKRKLTYSHTFSVVQFIWPYLKKAINVCLFVLQLTPNKFIKHIKKKKENLDFENWLPILLQQFTEVANIIYTYYFLY